MVLSEKINRISPLARAILVIGAVAALVTSVTYAAFVDSVTLTGNSFTTASANADLLIWNAPNNNFEDSAPGFQFGELEPGVESAKKDFYFKNDGNIPLYLTVSVPEDDTTFNGVDPTKVSFKFYGECAEAEGQNPVEATMAQLQAGEVDLPCDPLEEDAQGVVGQEGNEANYAVSVTLDESIEPLEEEVEPTDVFTLLFNGYSEDADTGGEPAPAS